MTDLKITELPSSTDVSSTDLFVVVDDPGGSPVTKSITYDLMFSAINQLRFSAATELTCDTDGAVTMTQNFHTIDTNADDASDDLVTINGGLAGFMLFIRPANDARTVVVKHNTGNILLNGGQDVTMDDQGDVCLFVYDSAISKWCGGSFNRDYAASLVSAKGELIVGTAASAIDNLAAPTTDGQKLVSKAAETTGLIWIDDDFGFNFVIGSGVATVSTGVAGYVELPFTGVFESARLFADAAGSIVVDLWKNTYANYPPTDTDSITASATPTLSTDDNSEDTTLTGWTTAFTAGDVLGINVDSVTTCKQVTLSLRGRRTATA